MSPSALAEHRRQVSKIFLWILPVPFSNLAPVASGVRRRDWTESLFRYAVSHAQSFLCSKITAPSFPQTLLPKSLALSLFLSLSSFSSGFAFYLLCSFTSVIWLMTLACSIIGSFSVPVMTQQGRRERHGVHSGIAVVPCEKGGDVVQYTGRSALHDSRLFHLVPWSILSSLVPGMRFGSCSE